MYNKFTTNGQKFVTSQHLDMSRCWALAMWQICCATTCRTVVSLSVGSVVQHVRSRCPRIGVWHYELRSSQTFPAKRCFISDNWKLRVSYRSAINLLSDKKVKCLKKVKGACSALHEYLSHSYGASLAIWDHSVTCHPTYVRAPHLNPSPDKPVLDLPTPEG